MKNILALLADFANGIFAVVLVGYFTDTEILWWHFLVGIPLAMLPDLDALPELLQSGKVSASALKPHDHREILHYPIVFVLLGLILGSIFDFWGWIFLTAVTLHFVNDLYGTGWGIALFWPFTKDRFKVFVDKNNNFSWHSGIRRIPHENLQTEIIKYGKEDWVDDVYLTINSISVVEYGLFTFAMILLVLTLLY